VTTTSVHTLRIGTRRSALALAQTGAVADVLRAAGHGVELVEVVTDGDRSTGLLAEIGGTGVFVTELRNRLLAGDIDVAVHSYKDLPTVPAEGLTIAAVPPRADPRDALVARDDAVLAELPSGSRVGTGSPRRAAQLLALGYGLEIEPIRGNVDTRLQRVADGDLDAVVVAAAGLQRLGRLAEATEILDPGQVLPAPAQGALAVECRSADEELGVVLAAALEEPHTRAAVVAAPVGALADVSIGDGGDDELYLRAVVVDVTGQRSIRLSTTGPLAACRALGTQLADDLLDEGAAELIGTIPASTSSHRP
jgi:hydroxymethylbilane synthase